MKHTVEMSRGNLMPVRQETEVEVEGRLGIINRIERDLFARLNIHRHDAWREQFGS